MDKIEETEMTIKSFLYLLITVGFFELKKTNKTNDAYPCLWLSLSMTISNSWD